MAIAPTLVASETGGSAPSSIVLPDGFDIDLRCINATFNGAAASGAFLPACTVFSQSGQIIGRFVPVQTLSVGDSGVVTYAGFLGLAPTTPAPQNAHYIAVVRTDFPWLFWTMQDTGPGTPPVKLVDDSGNTRDAEGVGGSPEYHVPGPFASDFAVHYSNTFYNSLFSGGSAPNIVDNFTLECWVKPNALVASSYVWQAGLPTGFGWSIFLKGTGKFCGLANNVALLADSAGTLGVGQWYYIVIVRDSGTWKYYLDGALDTGNAGNTAPAPPTDLNAVVGPILNGTNGDLTIAYACIYDHVLTPAEIAAHHAAASH